MKEEKGEKRGGRREKVGQGDGGELVFKHLTVKEEEKEARRRKTGWRNDRWSKKEEEE